MSNSINYLTKSKGVKPTTHNLKILPNYFQDVYSGKKMFEVRLNDRDYQVGDMLYLQEWSPEDGYTGNYVKKDVYYILDDPAYVKEGFVILGL